MGGTVLPAATLVKIKYLFNIHSQVVQGQAKFQPTIVKYMQCIKFWSKNLIAVAALDTDCSGVPPPCINWRARLNLLFTKTMQCNCN